MKRCQRDAILLAANWDSGVGYAWWLMESYWACLAEKYAGDRPVLLAYPSISTIPRRIAEANLQIETCDFTLTSIRSVLSQCFFLKQRNIGTIYFSDQHPIHWRYAAFRLAGVRCIIVHDHAPGLRDYPRGLKRLIKLGLQRLPWLTADRLFGASEFVKERLINVVCAPSYKCFSIPNGLPEIEGLEASDVHTDFGIPAERRIFVGTGRAHEYKGVDFALQCIRKLVIENGHRDLHYLYCGDGPHLAQFKQLARDLGIADYVSFPGRCDNIPAVLLGCYCAFHPSLGEVGYSLSILEYMRAGLPVIVPDDPSVCEATAHEKTGLIYTRGDVQDACLAIERLLSDFDLSRLLGGNAKKSVSEEFSLTKSHAALLAAFLTVVPSITPAD